jgi:hypothetical protein
MTERDWRRSLRGAVHRGDGVAVVALVRTGGMRDHALQLIGEGMLAAIIGHVEHAVELGADCVNALRARGWYGDDDLAEQLDATLGRGSTRDARSSISSRSAVRPLGTRAVGQRRTTFGAMTLYTLAAADRVRDPDLAVVAGDEALRGRQQVATSPRRVQRRRTIRENTSSARPRTAPGIPPAGRAFSRPASAGRLDGVQKVLTGRDGTECAADGGGFTLAGSWTSVVAVRRGSGRPGRHGGVEVVEVFPLLELVR